MSAFSAAADGFTRWAQRWIPDAFVFALIATVLAAGAGVAVTHGDIPRWSRAGEGVSGS